MNARDSQTTRRFANREEAIRAGMAEGEALARRHNIRDALRISLVFAVLFGFALWMILS